MDPLYLRMFSDGSQGFLRQTGTYAAPAKRWMHRRIKQERVDATIPRHVRVANESLAIESPDPGEATGQHLIVVLALVRRRLRLKELPQHFTG